MAHGSTLPSKTVHDSVDGGVGMGAHRCELLDVAVMHLDPDRARHVVATLSLVLGTAQRECGRPDVAGVTSLRERREEPVLGIHASLTTNRIVSDNVDAHF